MDQDLVDLVLKTVDEFVLEDKLFTAHDITVAARKHTMKNLRHSEARHHIHTFMATRLQAGLYEAEPADLERPQGAEMPILYYPVGSDPNSYGTAGPGNNRFARLAAATALATSVASDDAQADQRGRICLPANLVRGLGLKHGLPAYVSIGTNKLIVTATPPNGQYRTYLVDKHDNLRVSKSTTALACLVKQAYTFEVHPDRVEVS